MATGGTSDAEIFSDETFEFLCSVCNRKNRNTEADKFCSDCHDYYCSNCVKVHEDVPALSEHKILDRKQFQACSGAALPVLPTERCRRHAHKPVDMYCQNHDTVGCSTCMASDHRICKNVVYVPDLINHACYVDNSQTLLTDLERISNCLKDLQNAFGQEKQSVINNKEKVIKKIRQYREEINDKLEELENNSLEELEARAETVMKKIQDEINEVKAIQTEAEASQQKLKSAGGNMAQLFVSTKLITSVTLKSKAKVETTQADALSVDIDFTGCEKIHALLNELQTLGQISVQQKMQYESSGYVTSTVVTEQRNKFVADISSTNETNRPVANRQASTKPVNQQGKSRHPTDIKMTFSSPMKVKESKTYAVKMPADKSACDITSLCTLADGTINAVDNANKNLKHLNSSDFHIMDTCDLPESPWQLCAISQQEVAVCCSDANIIQFVSVEQNMKTTKKIDTEFYCCGLAHAAGKLYVSEFNLLSEQPEYLYILTLSGEVLQQFSVDQSGHRLFNNVSSLAISNDNNKIYVADWDKGLVVLNRNGNLIRQFNGQELTDAFGVCVDKTGNVLVSGLHSNNVLQFSSDGELIGEVMKTNDSCQAICFLQDNSKMIISFENKNEIKVYDIS